MGNSAVDALSREGLPSRVRSPLRFYFLLAKPRILFLVTLTGLVAMVLEGSLLSQPLRFAGVLLGVALAGAAANALNQFLDRDIDAIMARTKCRRPIPTGMISPRNALYFSLFSGGTALLLLQMAGSTTAALLAFGTIGFYVLIYTVWLKRRTSLNIVVGGAAGAAPPLIGWAAGAGELSMVPLHMFLIILLWTPLHFWALAISLKDDYARAGIPMLPVVAGEKHTCIQITAYAFLLIPVVIWFGISAGLGWFYFAGSTLLGLNLLRKIHQLWRVANNQVARELFGYSNLYLTVLFLLMLVPQG